jgi:hypothetical protein
VVATTSSEGPWIEEWLSIGRFSTYLAAAGGSRSRALEPYEWNAKAERGINRHPFVLRCAHQSPFSTCVKP